uniref:Uncharacterized protein n=1 Tax=Pseudomonas phage HRDY3 TaxID=3236930 RepID=A0AB39CEB9_9VIRU
MVHYSYWIITAHAHIPGNASLCVFGEYRLPLLRVAKLGMRSCLEEIVRDAEVSLSHKYNTLVRKHAPKNKRAQAALDMITEWQDKQRGPA